MAFVLACMHVYSTFNLQLFLSILFFYNCFNLVLNRQTETVNGTSISSENGMWLLEWRRN